ncbi:MAG: NAD(P)-binding protein, partial [Desulfovibrionaceae bacterium]|nr:NAD(P)-binding protein [Desulfovibrionaceae bacterium]
MNLGGLRYLVVGAGLWGLVLAERIASQLGERVLVLDRRNHSGGNCYAAKDSETGIERHIYGTHVFHTSLPRVWEYLNRFTSFTNYRHRVYTEYRGRVHPLPLGLAAINSFYGFRLKPWEMEEFIRKESGGGEFPDPANLEEKAVSLVGRPLYEAFIKGYSQKQWGRHPRELPPEVIARLPVRSSYNTDYFDDLWQGMPAQGYTALFARLLRHPLIDLQLGVEYASIADMVPKDCQILYSGPIDAFFN